MLTVACVAAGDYFGRGDEYVEKLKNAVARNLGVPYRFECIREGPANW